MAAAVKAKGFSLFPGIAGKCSLPMAGSPASGVGEGSGMPSAEAESILQDPGRVGGGGGQFLHSASVEHPLDARHSSRHWGYLERENPCAPYQTMWHG